MPFLLLGIRGPVIGVVQRIGDGLVTLGRDPACQLQLPDLAVSRRHCEILAGAGGIQVRDLGSFNGTFLNGIRVGASPVGHDDELRLGSCVFRVVDENLDSGFDPLPGPSGNSVLVRTGEADSLEPPQFDLQQLAQRLYWHESNRCELAALLELSAVLPPITAFSEARRRFFEIVFRVIPAARAVLALADPATGGLCASYGWERGAGSSAAVRLPEAALAACMEERTGAFLHDEGRQRPFWLCPLPCQAGAAGVVAVEPEEDEGLKSRHRNWLFAAARLAGGLLLSLHEMERLRKANRQLTAEFEARSLIVGDSPAIAAVKAQILRAAPSETTVLITGETGAGKEPVARAIHAGSARAAGPFVAVNCATLSPSLLESDLFGHERGAFTGAVALKRGRIEAAAGGTLFLDEIGELDPGIQARLLRVLQEREFERVGGLAPLRADIRLVAATNRDLAREVERGSFRKDLYYRINVVAIHVPPLRERRADIPLLAAHFITASTAPAGQRVRGLSPRARRRLMAYDWPGNVRELQNAIEHGIVFSRGEWIEEEDLPESVLEPAAPDAAAEAGYYSSLREAKRRILLAALAECGGSQQEAARKLGLNPSHLSRLIRNLGLRPEAGSMR